MNNVIEFASPAPSCLVPITHPARANDLNRTDLAETFNRHSVYELGDDYDQVIAEDHLSAIGGFK